ncbi:hypothetical protein AB0M34_08730 [Nocardia sp. NPDC050193]
MIALGLVVAAGIPLAVLVLAVVLPVPGERPAERDSHGGNDYRSRRGFRSH